MFKRILVAGWVALFVGTALLLMFPRAMVRVLSPTVLLVYSLVLIFASLTFGLKVAYRRVIKQSGRG